MKILLSLTLALLVSGCATSRFGDQSGMGAVYRYSKQSQDGTSCTLEITTGQEAAAASIAIDDCDMAADAKDLEAVAIPQELLQLLLDRAQ